MRHISIVSLSFIEGLKNHNVSHYVHNHLIENQLAITELID
jgi:hypothetical protein